MAAIDSALNQTATPHEVIVSVDNNPQLADELASSLPSSVVIVRNQGEPGESATRNVGIAKATGDIVAFLDDDAVAELDWLEKLLELFLNAEVMVAGGQSLPSWESGRAPRWFPTEYEFIIGCTGHLGLMITETREIRNPAGSNMAVRREAFDKLGGWKRELGRGQVKTGGGEAELCLRIKGAFPHSLVLHEPSAIVHHKVPRERATLRYVLPYAYHEGIVRAKLRKYALQYTERPLEGEGVYLRRLIDTAIPRRLKQFYRPASLAQLGVIVANTGLVALGYIRGRLTYR